ncbi:MAG: transcriptional repressor [Micrococcales bacterium]|nr:transcriptional repressor [Micrococcales bacterium]
MSSTPGERPRVAAALSLLRSAGERVTPARHVVLRVLDVADRGDEHLSAEQIGQRVAALEPSIHRATVYRTLTALTDAGVLAHVHLGGSATVYHLAAPPTAPVEPVEPGASAKPRAGMLSPAEGGTASGARDPSGEDRAHAHVQCACCGRVLDVAPQTFDDAAARLEEDLGFILDTSHAALLGRCAECRRPSPLVRP